MRRRASEAAFTASDIVVLVTVCSSDLLVSFYFIKLTVCPFQPCYCCSMTCEGCQTNRASPKIFTHDSIYILYHVSAIARPSVCHISEAITAKQ